MVDKYARGVVGAMHELAQTIYDNAQQQASAEAERMAKYSDREISLARLLQTFEGHSYEGHVAPIYLNLSKNLLDDGLINETTFYEYRGVAAS